jgi:hypothetical protein
MGCSVCKSSTVSVPNAKRLHFSGDAVSSNETSHKYPEAARNQPSTVSHGDLRYVVERKESQQLQSHIHDHAAEAAEEAGARTFSIAGRSDDMNTIALQNPTKWVYEVERIACGICYPLSRCIFNSDDDAAGKPQPKYTKDAAENGLGPHPKETVEMFGDPLREEATTDPDQISHEQYAHRVLSSIVQAVALLSERVEHSIAYSTPEFVGNVTESCKRCR